MYIVHFSLLLASISFNTIETKLFYEKNNKRNPVITNVSIIHNENDIDGDKAILTLLGEDKKIAEIESISSSRSGWAYGAYVRLRCDLLRLDEILSQW